MPLALKFLSNADLVLQLGLLKYELFIIAWAIISILAMAYLFGWLAKKSSPKKPSTTKGFFAGILLIFAGYLLMGLSIDEEQVGISQEQCSLAFPLQYVTAF